MRACWICARAAAFARVRWPEAPRGAAGCGSGRQNLPDTDAERTATTRSSAICSWPDSSARSRHRGSGSTCPPSGSRRRGRSRLFPATKFAERTSWLSIRHFRLPRTLGRARRSRLTAARELRRLLRSAGPVVAGGRAQDPAALRPPAEYVDVFPLIREVRLRRLENAGGRFRSNLISALSKSASGDRDQPARRSSSLARRARGRRRARPRRSGRDRNGSGTMAPRGRRGPRSG